jgi:hypothetical protein
LSARVHDYEYVIKAMDVLSEENIEIDIFAKVPQKWDV